PAARAGAQGHAARAGVRRARVRDPRHHGHAARLDPRRRLIQVAMPTTPIRTMPPPKPKEAGMSDYLKEAFLFRWNLLFLFGSAAAAGMTPLAGVLLPLVAAGELTYLTGLISIPRFRAAIDAKVHGGTAAGLGPKPPVQPPMSLMTMLAGLPS